jgi:hypothetical protein
MKNLILISLLALVANSAWATCSSPISRTAFSPSTTIRSTTVNTQFDTVYNHVNNMDGDCIQDSSINKTKLEAGYKDVAVTSVTTTYTALSTDEVISASASGASFTITLPTAVGTTGRQYTIKKTDSTSNTVTIDGNSAETIDGATTYVLNEKNQAVRIVSNGSNWIVQGGLSNNAYVFIAGAGNSGGAVTANTTDLTFTEVTDTHSAWSGTQFTVPFDGVYVISGNVFFTTSDTRAVSLYIGGSISKRISDNVTSTNHAFGFSGRFTAGQVISFRVTATATQSNDTTFHYINITKIPGLF